MNLKEIAEKLGIENYPESLEQAVPVSICDEERIRALQEEFDFFGDFYEEVLQEVKALAESPVLSSRSLLVLRVKHSSVSVSIPDSLTIPSPVLPPGNDQVITEY